MISPIVGFQKPNAPAKLRALNEKEARRQLQPVVIRPWTITTPKNNHEGFPPQHEEEYQNLLLASERKEDANVNSGLPNINSTSHSQDRSETLPQQGCSTLTDHKRWDVPQTT
jgi:hypothetical protein